MSYLWPDVKTDSDSIDCDRDEDGYKDQDNPYNNYNYEMVEVSCMIPSMIRQMYLKSLIQMKIDAEREKYKLLFIKHMPAES